MYQTVLSFGIANPSNPAALTATVAQSFMNKFIAAIDCAGVSANEDMELELAANINSLPISEEVKESALAAILYFDQFGFGKKQTAKTQAHCAAINALLCAVCKIEKDKQDEKDAAFVAQALQSCPQFSAILEQEKRLEYIIQKLNVIDFCDDEECALAVNLHVELQQLEEEGFVSTMLPSKFHVANMAEYKSIKDAFSRDGEFQSDLYKEVYYKHKTVERIDKAQLEMLEKISFVSFDEDDSEQQNQPSELPAENMQEAEQKADFSLPTCNLFAAAPYNTALSNNTKTNFCSMLAPADEKRYGQKRPFFEKDGYSPQDLAIIKDWVEPVRQGSDIRQAYWYETEGDPQALMVEFRVERVKDDDGEYAYELELTDESAIVLPKDYVCPAAYAKTKGEQRKFLLTSIKEFLQDRFYQALRILK